MAHFFAEVFELLFELIEILEPYLLATTIFVIPFAITVTALPKRFFQHEFMQHLLPGLYARYERKKDLLNAINETTQVFMEIILMVDLFGVIEYFLHRV